MFVSFFPSPRLFFWSAAGWSLFAVLFWFFVARNAGYLIGLENPPAGSAKSISILRFLTAPFLWFFLYYAIFAGVFIVAWKWLSSHRWFAWSVPGSILIVFVTYLQVEVSVIINDWYGEFYDLIQKSLGKPGSIPASTFYLSMLAITIILATYILVFTCNRFFVRHYVFRWRTAMNEYYTENWPQLRGIEGAAQRVQEDTMRFAKTSELLGAEVVDSLLTLIAFLPVLVTLSTKITELPLLGAVPNSLVIVAVLWSAFGTGFLALIGIRLPGLEFRSQRVEAAYRKELVYGEDDGNRAQPPALSSLFAAVKQNYYRMYFNYLYFDIGRLSFLQTDRLLPYLVTIPTVVAGTITFGIWRQIINAFEQVRVSFLYLVNAWPTVIELISIYKRLRAFEATLHGEALPQLDQEFIAGVPSSQ